MPFEVIDHTADTGIRVQAPDLASLYREAARGMFGLIADLSVVDASMTQAITIEGIDQTDLLINMLRELLYMFNGQGRLVKSVEIETLSDTALTGRAAHEAYDPEKHAITCEIKAVTFAGGDIRKIPEGFEITIIFDI